MSEADLAPILRRDWGKEMCAGVAVIEILGVCRAYTVKPEILAMEIKHDDLSVKSLLANLTTLGNEGQGAFQQAHLDCDSIATYAYSIGRKGGYIDKVLESYGKPALKKRLQRALNALERQAQNAQNDGTQTLQVFEEWKKKTTRLTEAVTDKLGSKSTKIEEAKEVIHCAEQSFENAQKATTEADKSYNDARQRADDAEKTARELKQDLSFWGQLRTLGPIALVLWPAVGTFVGMANEIRVTQAKGAYQAAVTHRQHTFEKLEWCKMHLKAQQDALKAANTSQITWTNIGNVINEVLQELTSLQNNVCRMVGFFQGLSKRVGKLVTRYQEDVKSMIEEEDLEEESMKDLVQYSQEVKMLCLVVYTMSSAYSRMSYDHVIPGFEIISRLVDYSSESLSAEEQIKRAIGVMKIYSSDAQVGVIRLVEKAKINLWEEAKRAYPELTDESRLNPQGIPPKYQPSALEASFSVKNAKEMIA